ncbi:MAG TPA: hypothetical protein PKH65_04315 [Bacteroidia bacterium]|nr:hypothetical protein [Bacteroidia bacterium]HNT79883.1 hypothetical protein [Bacteroidia bacterium]
MIKRIGTYFNGLQKKAGLIFLVLFSLFLFGFAAKEQYALKCKALVVKIVNDAEITFLDESDVEQIILEGGQVKLGSIVADINMAMLEKKIELNPYVANAEVFSTVDGKLYAEVTQRKPLIRLINQHGEHFYIDTEGDFVPVSDKSAYSVIVANGFIYNNLKEKKAVAEVEIKGKISKSLAYQLYELGRFFDTHEFWNNQIEQVYVNVYQQIELIPRIGNQRIVLGNTDQLEARFEKLMLFYKEAMPRVGWDAYSKINLMYDGQVVCTKNN